MPTPETTGAVGAATIAGATGVSSTLLPDFPLSEYLIGTAFCIAGAVAWQFLTAQVAREAAAHAQVPVAERPSIDWITLGYAILGAPLAAGWLLYAVHLLGGDGGLLSIGGFMLAGAAGPVVVSKAVAGLGRLLPGETAK